MLALLFVLLLSGCSTLKAITPPAAAALCMSADVATSIIGREAYGLREANPLMQNYGVLIGSKLGAFALIYAADRWIAPVPAWTWYTVAGMNCGVAGWNVAQVSQGDR